MAKIRSEHAAAIVLFANGLLVFIPALYLSGSFFFACVPYVHYGFHRAWSESITAEPVGKAWIRFSTGETTSYGATGPLKVMTILLMLLFPALAASLFCPVFQLTQLCLARVAPQFAKEMDALTGRPPESQRDARE